MPVGDDQSVKAAKALALPTRSAILAHLLTSGPLTAKEVADEFSLHANVARAHLDLLVEAGFLATGVRRKRKGRPAKVYFTWEGEMGALEDWEVSPQPGIVPPESEMLVTAAEPLPAAGHDVAAQVRAIQAAIEAAPKSRSWRLRSRIGERVKWYETPEEVRH